MVKKQGFRRGQKPLSARSQHAAAQPGVLSTKQPRVINPDKPISILVIEKIHHKGRVFQNSDAIAIKAWGDDRDPITHLKRL